MGDFYVYRSLIILVLDQSSSGWYGRGMQNEGLDIFKTLHALT